MTVHNVSTFALKEGFFIKATYKNCFTAKLAAGFLGKEGLRSATGVPQKGLMQHKGSAASLIRKGIR